MTPRRRWGRAATTRHPYRSRWSRRSNSQPPGGRADSRLPRQGRLPPRRPGAPSSVSPPRRVRWFRSRGSGPPPWQRNPPRPDAPRRIECGEPTPTIPEPRAPPGRVHRPERRGTPRPVPHSRPSKQRSSCPPHQQTAMCRAFASAIGVPAHGLLGRPSSVDSREAIRCRFLVGKPGGHLLG